MCRLSTCTAALLLTLLAVGRLWSQDLGQLSGTLLDDADGRPVPGGLVELQTERGRVVRTTMTDDEGRFTFPVNGGDYRLRVWRIGNKEEKTSVFTVQPVDTVEVIVRLNLQALMLPSLEVVARARPVNAQIEAFEDRRRRAIGGQFITQEEIELRNPSRLTDMLEGVVGFMVQGKEVQSARRTRLHRGCIPAIYVDGSPVSTAALARGSEMPVDVINLIPAGDVHGVEIYQGVSQLPGEFSGSNALCGVIAIWTRRGGS